MKAAIAFLCRLAAPLLILAGGLAAVVVRLKPDLWERTAAHWGATSELFLQPPLWAAVTIFALGIAAMAFGMNDGAGGTTKHSTSHGSACFSTTAEVRAAGYGEKGIPLCMEDWADVVSCPSPEGKPGWKVNSTAPVIACRWLHVLVEGPTGTGKDESVFLPTLLTDFGRSFVSLDPKGTMYERSAGYRSIFTVVFRFAPCEEGSCRYNPMKEIKVGTMREATDAARIAGVLVGSAAMEDMSSRIYLKSCEAVLACAILHVLNKRPAREHTLPGVTRFLLDRKRTKKMIVQEMIDDPPVCAEMVANSVAELQNDPKMLQGAFTTLVDVLNFCSMPLVEQALSGSDFVASDLSQQDKTVSLYLVIPFADADIMRPLARLMLDCLVSSHGLERKHDTAYLLNELPSLGYIGAIGRGIGEVREYGVQFVLGIQSEAQLYNPRAYGKEGAITILDNCGARVTLGVQGQNAAESMRDRMGKTTIVRPRHTQAVSRKSLLETTVTDTKGEGEQARELLTADEAKVVPSGEIIVELPGVRPYRGKRLVRYDTPELMRRSQILPPNIKRTQNLRRVK